MTDPLPSALKESGDNIRKHFSDGGGGAMVGGIVGPLIVYWMGWPHIPPLVFSTAFFSGAFAKTILRFITEGRIIETILTNFFRRSDRPRAAPSRAVK